MVKVPVAIVWDGSGKWYLAEILTYMQDADAKDEQKPISSISVLENANLDGKMDKSIIFIDSLLLPRMIHFINVEPLVNETNTLYIYSYKDTGGDEILDHKKLVY